MNMLGLISVYERNEGLSAGRYHEYELDVPLTEEQGESLAVYGGDESDNSASSHTRICGWIFYGGGNPNNYVNKNTTLTCVESGCHSDTESEYHQSLAGP